MATLTNYISSYGSEYSNPSSTPLHYPESNYPDSYSAINQLIAPQLEQQWIIHTATVPNTPTPNASMTSHDGHRHNPNPIKETIVSTTTA